MKFDLKIDYKHSLQFYEKHCKLTITNIVTMQNFEVMSDTLYIKPVFK
jgi:hypothetical protein